jgi:hypothetical protein
VQPPAPKPVAAPVPRPASGGVKPPRPSRPAAPTRSIAPPTSTANSSNVRAAATNAADDDDAVIVPAPEPSVFAPRPMLPPLKREAFYASIGFRRTVIPILLTMGVALPGCAIWWCFLDQDSPLKTAGLRFPITLAVGGIILLGLGILNMLQVKSQLQSRPDH